MLRDGDRECANQDRAADDEARRVELERSATTGSRHVNVTNRRTCGVGDTCPRRSAGSVRRRILGDRRHRESSACRRAARIGKGQCAEQGLRSDRVRWGGRLRPGVNLYGSGSGTCGDSCLDGIERRIFYGGNKTDDCHCDSPLVWGDIVVNDCIF